jgi:hypothetical protein
MPPRKTLLAPIHFIFSLLQKRNTVSIWLYEQLAFRIEGKIRVCAPGPGDKKELSSTRIELCD